MVWRAFMLGLAVLAAMVLEGCTTTPVIQPKGKVVVPVNTAVRVVEAKAAVLNEVVIELPPIATPGQKWTIVYNDARFLQLRRPIEPLPDGRGFTVSFLAVHDGRRAVRFFALHPGRREEVPRQTYEVRFEIE